MNPAIVWFRNDLRLEDNPALPAAWDRPIIPVFIWSAEEEGTWAPGAASRWWLHHSLLALSEELEALRSRLVILHGPALENLLSVARQTGADAVFWNRRYEPAIIQRDATVREGLRQAGLTAESFNGSLLFEPGEIKNQQGQPYQVYTTFWKACRARASPSQPSPAPEQLIEPERRVKSLPLESLSLLPRLDWAGGIRAAWTPGSKGANQELERFLREGRDEYSKHRDRPDRPGTSRLSPHLHFGEISPRTVWHRVQENVPPRVHVETYLKELCWREFAHHLLFHFPQTPDQPLRQQFVSFPWKSDESSLRAWQRGQTGYPLVDAGMRQLWSMGWMHNRVRMVVASFLVKDLLVPWQQGARWFWDTLVDADLANNSLNWQWVAGCGADAAPFFRIFNPVRQSEKFDPEGVYIHEWLPELRGLPPPWVHKPWEAPVEVLRSAGVELGRTYPAPLIDHARARDRALIAFRSHSDRPAQQ
jgi:deoxyribodipyrimidine photo-lyase